MHKVIRMCCPEYFRMLSEVEMNETFICFMQFYKSIHLKGLQSIFHELCKHFIWIFRLFFTHRL